MGRPTLSVYMLTWNSSDRLSAVLRNVASVADEIVVGVDAESDQETFDVACRHADVIFRFEHTGLPEHARMRAIELAGGDWVLALDDDECMEEGFAKLLPELLADTRYTHYYFPTKWIASLDPVTYLCGAPWYPDWHIRLFRRDLRLVWHPPRIHEGLRVQGLGAREDRVALLHFERFARTATERQDKLRRYQALGSTPLTDSYYLSENAPRRPLETESPPWQASELFQSPAPKQSCHVVPGVYSGTRQSQFPPFQANVRAEMPAVVAAGESIVVPASAHNTGDWSWFPPGLSSTTLAIGYHVFDASGETAIWDGIRTPVGRIVWPGETARFLASFVAPAESGMYVVEWDMVSESECWFAQLDSATHRLPLEVV